MFTEKGFHLPPDHKPVLKVPTGGSNCANCEYKGKGNTCTNQYFIQWNGSDKLPYPADKMCSDWWMPKEKKEVSLKDKLSKYKL